jgi:transposase-like protein
VSKPLTSEMAGRVADSKCPFCGSGDVSYDNIDVDGDWAVQHASCPGCEESWGEEYKFSHVHSYVTSEDYLPEPEVAS